MKKIHLIVLLTLVFFLTNAQNTIAPGYIIELNGDTILGEIRDLDWIQNPKEIEFRKKGTSSFSTYYSKTIKGFFASESKRYFHSHTVHLNISSHMEGKLRN